VTGFDLINTGTFCVGLILLISC